MTKGDLVCTKNYTGITKRLLANSRKELQKAHECPFASLRVNCAREAK